MFIDTPFSQQISYISILRKIFYKYKFALFILTTFCCSANAFARQTIPYSYQYYNTAHGLPSTQITCLAKDSKGFLWIGTAAGISMYDGYSFKNYAYTNKHELIGYVNTIKAGADNRLWIGTGAGLFCCINNEVIKVSAATLLPQGVNDILPEINGTIWLATENGPAKFSSSDVDFTGNKKILLTSCLLKQWKVKNEMIESRRTVLISNAGDGTIYIATDNSLYRLINDTLGIIYTTTRVRDKITTLFPVSKSLVYFDAASTEINKIDNGKITHVNPETLYKPGTENRNGGKWYVGTRGAYNFHANDGKISGAVSFSDKYIVWPTAILKENDFLWVATSDGLVKMKPSIFTAYELDKKSHYNDYYSITTLRNGKLLLGTNAGKIYEKKENLFSLYKDNLFPGAEVKGLYEDENGWLWVASGYQGLVVIRNGNAERFTIENGLHDNSVYQFYKSANGKLYVFGDRGMSEIIVGGGKNISFKKYYYQPNISRHAKFYSGIEAPDGSIWLGGEEGIVFLRNDSLLPFTFKGKQVFVNFLIK